MPILGKDGKYRPLGTDKTMNKDEYYELVNRGKSMNAKYGKKGSDYRAGSAMLRAKPGMMGPRKPEEVPAIEESLYTEDDLG